jgi:hypothetical protein
LCEPAGCRVHPGCLRRGDNGDDGDADRHRLLTPVRQPSVLFLLNNNYDMVA